MATLIPALARLRDEFNRLAPKRDKASDGWIGAPAHAARTSDHNPDDRGYVHAIDVDVDLNLPGTTMEECVQLLVKRCREGKEKRLKYVIYNRRIWSASRGWKQEQYAGTNPHDKHAHFSGVNTPSLERDVSDFHLDDVIPPPPAPKPAPKPQEQAVAFDSDEKKYLDSLMGDVVPRWDNNGNRVPDNDPNPRMTVREGLFYVGAGARRAENLGQKNADELANLRRQVASLEDKLASVSAVLDQIATAVVPPAQPGN